MEAGQSTQSENQLLDLASPLRTSRLKLAGRLLRHHFNPITQSDWLDFLKRELAEVTAQNDGVVIVRGHSDEAAWWLWERRIATVEGYDFADAQRWKELVPVTHQPSAVELQREVYATNLDFDEEHQVVTLEATWNERVYEGLQHSFRQPRKEHVLRFKRGEVRYQAIGGSRKGGRRILLPSQAGTLVELYDELVISQETAGYVPFKPGDMDALHKITAITAVFEPRSVVTAEEESITE